MTIMSDFPPTMTGKYLLLMIKQAQMMHCISCKLQVINQTAKLNANDPHGFV